MRNLRNKTIPSKCYFCLAIHEGYTSMFLHYLSAIQVGTLFFTLAHPNAQHGTGSGPWEVLRGREGAGKLGFQTPWELLHGKCVSSSPGRTRTKELNCSMGECK